MKHIRRILDITSKETLSQVFVLFKSNYESIFRYKDVQNTIEITFIHFLPFSEKHESKIAQLTMHTWFRKSNQSLIRTQRLFLFKTTHRKHTKQ